MGEKKEEICDSFLKSAFNMRAHNSSGAPVQASGLADSRLSPPKVSFFSGSWVIDSDGRTLSPCKATEKKNDYPVYFFYAFLRLAKVLALHADRERLHS